MDRKEHVCTERPLAGGCSTQRTMFIRGVKGPGPETELTWEANGDSRLVRFRGGKF